METKAALNYRPISFTSVVDKIIKKIFKDKFISYLEDNHMFFNIMHGFRYKLSCFTNLFGFFQGIFKN